MADELPATADEMGDIEFVSIYEHLAEYNTQKDEIIDGKTLKMNYSVYFVRDSAGDWYIDQF